MNTRQNNSEQLATAPLFVPLRREYFEAFERGEKTIEYRMAGGRWNSQTCRVGRRITLSLGYGKARRLHGVIADFYVDEEVDKIPGWRECYGDRGDSYGPIAACIVITMDLGTNRQNAGTAD